MLNLLHLNWELVIQAQPSCPRQGNYWPEIDSIDLCILDDNGIGLINVQSKCYNKPQYTAEWWLTAAYIKLISEHCKLVAALKWSVKSISRYKNTEAFIRTPSRPDIPQDLLWLHMSVILVSKTPTKYWSQHCSGSSVTGIHDRLEYQRIVPESRTWSSFPNIYGGEL